MHRRGWDSSLAKATGVSVEDVRKICDPPAGRILEALYRTRDEGRLNSPAFEGRLLDTGEVCLTRYFEDAPFEGFETDDGIGREGYITATTWKFPASWEGLCNLAELRRFEVEKQVMSF